MNQANQSSVNQSTEDRLRAEIDELRRQLEHHKRKKGPSAGTLLVVLMIVAALAVAGYFLGYLPRLKREQVLAAESRAEIQALPVVNVETVKRSSGQSNLVLPGTVQAVTEAPVLARATGYVRKRNVDIGDRVKAGQVLAEIEAPELKQQIRQANATIDQANQTVQQAEAGVIQGRANSNLAKVTRDRYKVLFEQKVIAQQDFDTRQAQFEAAEANVQALEKAIGAAKSNAAAAEANLARLNELLGYQTVRAPFAGVITQRNIDSGALVNEGSTLLFRIAQTDRLRTYLNVPQADADSVRTGQKATLTISDLNGRKVSGIVARTANALDPATRTLLVEVQVDNAAGALMPGMYTQVDLSVPRHNPPLLIPADTLVVRSDGPQVAVIGPDDVVHFARVNLGRDLGDRIEAVSGVKEGERLVVNPGDAVREGAKVKAVAAPDRKK
jgi:RND family efflux transporter MFP subunit